MEGSSFLQSSSLCRSIAEDNVHDDQKGVSLLQSSLMSGLRNRVRSRSSSNDTLPGISSVEAKDAKWYSCSLKTITEPNLSFEGDFISDLRAIVEFRDVLGKPTDKAAYLHKTFFHQFFASFVFLPVCLRLGFFLLVLGNSFFSL